MRSLSFALLALVCCVFVAQMFTQSVEDLIEAAFTEAFTEHSTEENVEYFNEEGVLLFEDLSDAVVINNLTLPAHSFIINENYTVYYDLNTADYITVAINFTMPGVWFGLGFGSMKDGSDLWAFTIVNNSVVATDMTGQPGYQPPKPDTALNGTNNLIILGQEVTPEYTFVKVQRLLDTSDPIDIAIHPNTNTSVLWSHGVSDTLSYHGYGNRGAVIQNFSE